MEDVEDERITFGKLTKFHSQYGTTSSSGSARVDNAHNCITHTVQVGDTLQGIAVKYGVAVSRSLADSQRRIGFNRIINAPVPGLVDP